MARENDDNRLPWFAVVALSVGAAVVLVLAVLTAIALTRDEPVKPSEPEPEAPGAAARGPEPTQPAGVADAPERPADAPRGLPEGAPEPDEPAPEPDPEPEPESQPKEPSALEMLPAVQ